MDNQKKQTITNDTPAPTRSSKRAFFRYRRAGMILTAEEVRQIKRGRRQLRREFRAAHITDRQAFRCAAVERGLYFDRHVDDIFLLQLLRGKWAWIWFSTLLALLTTLFLLSLVSKMKGHFTINLTDELFSEGFAIADSTDTMGDLIDPTTYLSGMPLQNTPCTSIAFLPGNLDSVDGPHNGDDYFAYTFYIKNEGASTVSYEYRLRINSESQALSRAVWVMVFEDGAMSFYARAEEDGSPQVMPPRGDNTRGYRHVKYLQSAKYPDEQYEVIQTTPRDTYYRLIPIPFASDSVVMNGKVGDVVPGETHKYTVVLWLEGDDPDCTNDLIGGHLGLEMDFQLAESEHLN